MTQAVCSLHVITLDLAALHRWSKRRTDPSPHAATKSDRSEDKIIKFNSQKRLNRFLKLDQNLVDYDERRSHNFLNR